MKLKLDLNILLNRKIKFHRVQIANDINFSMALNRKKNQYELSIVDNGLLKENVFLFFIYYLRRLNLDSKVLDIGANIGLYSLSSSAMGFDTLAVEMVYENCQILEISKKYNNFSNLDILNYAVGQKSGLVKYEGYAAWATTTTDPNALSSSPGRSLDDFQDHKIRIIKMDIEGSEMEALQSGASFLDSSEVDFIVEVNILTCGNHGYSASRIFAIFENYGFRSYRIVSENKLWRWTGELFQEIVYQDYFFTKRTESDLLNSIDLEIENPSVEVMKINALSQIHYGPPHWVYHLANRSEMLHYFNHDQEILLYLNSLSDAGGGHQELIKILTIGT